MFNYIMKNSLVLVGACALLAACQTSNAVDQQRSSLDSALERAAHRASDTGQTAQSLGYLEKIYKRNSEDPQVALNFAKALRESGYLLRATTVLSPFANEKKARFDVQNEYAAIQLAQGNYEVAERFARKSRVQEKDNPLANHYLGIALDAQGEHEEAEQGFRQALELWAGDPTSVMNNLALNLTSQGELDEAADILEKAQSIAPNKAEIERNLRIVRTLQQSHGYTIPKPTAKPDPATVSGAEDLAEPEETEDNG